jgi:diguanylate cyclase (GGDEF)-like protein/PAS domain S-box-containing protein
MEPRQVLLVEDNSADAFLHTRLLLKAGEALGHRFDVVHADSMAAAMARLGEARGRIDVVLLDLGLPDGDGLGSVGLLRSEYPDVAVVILTGHEDVQVALDAVAHGAQDFLVKGGIKPDALGRALDYAIVRRDLERAQRYSAAEHRALFDCNPQPLWVYDVHSLEILEVNAAAQRHYGWTREEFLRSTLAALFAPEDRPKLSELLAQRHAQADGEQVMWHCTRDGRPIQTRCNTHLLEFRGRPACMVLATDITESQRLLRDLEASEQRFRDLFERSLGLICEHALDGTLLALNPAAASALGYAASDLVGHHMREMVPERFWSGLDAYLAGIAAQGTFTGVFTVVRRDGQWRAWRCHNRLCIETGREPYVIGHAQDVTEELQREESLRDASLTDPLTQTRNRRYLEQVVRKGGLSTWGCVVVDLDHFKQINDTQGHQRGDEVLVGVAAFLRSHARRDDIVARTGGDEFLVLLCNDSADKAPALADRLQTAALSDSPCGLSLGVAVRCEGESLEATIARADEALYRARRLRRGDSKPAAAAERTRNELGEQAPVK